MYKADSIDASPHASQNWSRKGLSLVKISGLRRYTLLPTDGVTTSLAHVGYGLGRGTRFL